MHRPRSLSWALLLSCLLGVATPAQAEVRELTSTLGGEGQPSYQEFLQQAERQAEQLIQQGFAESAVTQVSVKVLGERDGTVAPLLSLTVSRANWQQQPQVQTWATYFRGATVLLGFVPRAGGQPTYTPSVSTAYNIPDSQPNYYDNR